MSDKQVKIGFDRFLALEWADYAIELFLNTEPHTVKYALLKEFLHSEIPGDVSAEKTSYQLKRMWLNEGDEFQRLRVRAAELLKRENTFAQSIFHLGLAINVFPVFKETCKRLGELSRVQEIINRKNVIDRVSQTYLYPSSIPRTVSRVIQTLEDWKLVEVHKKDVRLQEMRIENVEVGSWVVHALLSSQRRAEMPLSSINAVPEKLALKFVDLRQIVHQSDGFSIRYNASGEEIVIIKLEQTA